MTTETTAVPSSPTGPDASATSGTGSPAALPQPPTRRRGPSMAAVAHRAGVSSQTVSRVANGLSNVDAATRDRVLVAMEELGYRPNSAARALKTGRFQSIGVIMTTLSTYGNMRTLDAIATASAQAGYSITLMPIAVPTQGEVAGAFTRLTDQAVDGIAVLIEAHTLDNSDIVLPPGVPAVVLDSDAGDRYTVVDADQAEGARLATQHLLDLGHGTVFHVAGPESSFSAARRTESWRSTLVAAGATVLPPVVGDWTVESGYRIGMALDPAITAVFAANDQMALGLMRALHERGLSIPGDVSVVGFDDMGEAQAFWPPLTTVHQDFAEIGRRSIQALLHEIEDASRDVGTTIVPTRLVVRESTGRSRS